MNVAHRPIDIKNAAANYNKTSGYTQREIDGMDRFIASGLVDTFRYLHPDEVKYSWWSYRAKEWDLTNKGRRLDHIWATADIAAHTVNAEIVRPARGWTDKPSDHVPVITRFE